MSQQRDEKYFELVKLLEEQIRVYRGLLDVVRKEKDILVASNLDELTENNRSKEAMLLKIRGIEAQRIKVAAELTEIVGGDKDQPRLLELARAFNSDKGDKLRSMHSVLDLLIKRIQEHNAQNEVLVNSALQNITGAMKAVREVLQEKTTYQRKGEVAVSPAASGQLVRREV